MREFKVGDEVFTLGQVIDRLQHGEVAILVNEVNNPQVGVKNSTFYLGEDNVFRSTKHDQIIGIYKGETQGQYVIVKRELFDTFRGI